MQLFFWSKCYTFLESLLIREQNKTWCSIFFSRAVLFCRPECKSVQNHRNLKITWATNAITVKLYTIIVLRKINILQEIPRPEILPTLIYGRKWKWDFWSVKLSEIILNVLIFKQWQWNCPWLISFLVQIIFSGFWDQNLLIGSFTDHNKD